MGRRLPDRQFGRGRDDATRQSERKQTGIPLALSPERFTVWSPLTPLGTPVA